MSCCRSRPKAPASPPRVVPSPPPRPAAAAVAFRYTGSTAVTVVGPASGRTYRFASPGAVEAVDPRDAPSLAAVPVLRRA